jgi:pimeloyl-ACP methyl ester carboxylesterase
MDRTGANFLDIGDARLEFRMTGPGPEDAPTLVLLHEGLGGAGLWRDFPERLAAATGAGVFSYSRAGYGRSSPVALPRPLTYMHDEARDVLPHLLDRIGFRSGFLVGHSDGASIATIYMGERADARVRGLVLLAPHFFAEDHGIAAIERAREAYRSGELRERLGRWHDDPDNAFRGWNDAWLDPAFRRWDLTGFLPRIDVPVLIVQGTEDDYGTGAQIDAALERCGAPVEVALLEGVGHSPQRDAPEETLRAIAGFTESVNALRRSG